MQPEQTPNPIQQPVTSPEPAATATSAGTYDDYISNPFLNSVRGLVLMLKVNPVAIMLSGLVALLAFVALFVVQFILAFATSSTGSGGTSAVVSIVGFFAVVVGGLLLFGSYNVIAGRSAREEKVTVKESYSIAFKRFIGALVLLIIFLVLYALTSILLILPGIYFAARASLSFFVFYEENLSAVAALKRSFELTKGHAVEMLGAVVASALLGGGSGLLSGAISLSPLVGRYQDLKKLKESGAPKPKVHYLNWVTVIVVFLFIAAYVGFIALVFHGANRIQSQANYTKLQVDQKNALFNSSGGSNLNSATDPYSNYYSN